MAVEGLAGVTLFREPPAALGWYLTADEAITAMGRIRESDPDALIRMIVEI